MTNEDEDLTDIVTYDNPPDIPGEDPWRPSWYPKIVPQTYPKGVLVPSSSYLQYSYNMTQEDWRELYRLQEGKCAICSGPPPAGHNLFVDHDHDTGHVRGLLCTKCNVGLGMLGDDEEGVLRALDYIQNANWTYRNAAANVAL